MRPLYLAFALFAPLPALAHAGHAEIPGFVAGFLHPFSGVDHVVAMLMVGLWAATIGGRAMTQLPAVFLAGMALGFLVGDVAIPGVEAGILASTVLLAALAALALPMRRMVAMPLIGIAGLLHGHAHGAEGVIAASYGVGMLAASALLLLTGTLLAAPLGPWARRFGAHVMGRAA